MLGHTVHDGKSRFWKEGMRVMKRARTEWELPPLDSGRNYAHRADAFPRPLRWLRSGSAILSNHLCILHNCLHVKQQAVACLSQPVQQGKKNNLHQVKCREQEGHTS